MGGTHDHLIKKYHLKFAEVVFSVQEASDKGLLIDHDDSLAMNDSSKPFALLLHGVQPAGSPASLAWQALIKSGIGGYNRTRKRGDFTPKQFNLKVTLKSSKQYA